MIRFFCYILGFHLGIPNLLNDFLKFLYISFLYFVGSLGCEVLSLLTFIILFQFSLVQSLNHVWLFATPWTAACQAFLYISTPVHLLKHMSITSVMPVNHLIFCCPLLLCLQSFPASGSFPVNQLFTSGGQNIGVSASASILPKNIQAWFLLGWTGWMSFQSKGLSRVFSNTTVQKHQFFSAQLSL